MDQAVLNLVMQLGEEIQKTEKDCTGERAVVTFHTTALRLVKSPRN